jgi:hypothetical protein
MAKSRFVKELKLSALQPLPQQQKHSESGYTFNYQQFIKKEDSSRRDYSVYKVGQTVEHTRFGIGQIVSISDDGLVGDINFEDFGVKSLMLDLAPLTIIED